jgi:hypothetical protein
MVLVGLRVQEAGSALDDGSQIQQVSISIQRRCPSNDRQPGFVLMKRTQTCDCVSGFLLIGKLETDLDAFGACELFADRS